MLTFKEYLQESEEIDELNKDTLQRYADKATADHGHQNFARRMTQGDQQKEFARKEKNRQKGISRAYDRLYPQTEETQPQGEPMSTMEQYLAAIEGNADFRSGLEEKKLTPAELKKREEVAKAIERENPGMDKSKKMAIATATAKKVAEETSEKDLPNPRDYCHTCNTEPCICTEEMCKEGKEHTVPKTEKEKKLAALAEPKDKITHADVMTGRGVKKEEVDMHEGMISYSDFMDKIAMHKKAGNQIKDDKYTDKKASYTVVDKEGTAKKITHTSTGAKQEHLGNVKRDDDEDDAKEVKPTEKRGRGRPAGSKSGARH